MWPDAVIRQFAMIPPNPSEGASHGAYNKLLWSLFHADSEFVVAPQWIAPDSPHAEDIMAIYEVTIERKPLLILSLRPPSHGDLLLKRREADYQMRKRMTDMVGLCPIDTLYGISALGTKLCFYTLDAKNANAEIVPAAIARHPTTVNDVAPLDRWNLDVLDPAGEKQLRDIVEKIKAECAVL